MAKAITSTKVRASKKLLATLPKPIAEVIHEELHGAAKQITIHTVTTEFEFFPSEDMTFYLLKPGDDSVSSLEFPNQESVHAGNMRSTLMYGQRSTAPELSWVVIAHRFLGGLYIDVYEVLAAPKPTKTLVAVPDAPKASSADWLDADSRRIVEAMASDIEEPVKHSLGHDRVTMVYTLDGKRWFNARQLNPPKDARMKTVELFWVPALGRYVELKLDGTWQER